MPIKVFLLFVFLLALVLSVRFFGAQKDPLPSWKEGVAKKAIIGFVSRLTKKGSTEFVPVVDRIAVFDNDGTLWAEQPFPFQAMFVMDRVRALAPQHPEWKEKQPFKAVLENDPQALAASGMQGIAELMMATHAGMTTEEFTGIVKEWLVLAVHPTLKRPCTDLVYQPMLELLVYLREIISGFLLFPAAA